jgi:L-lactate dehydrogenase complex protein LldF
VAIDIPTMLVHLRAEAVDSSRRHVPSPERSVMTAAAWTMSDSRRWTRALRAGRLGRFARRSRVLPPPLSAWIAARDLPEPPAETFRDWWRREGRP